MAELVPSTKSGCLVPKILYIAGWGRSGSTLLDQVLGQIDGWFSCGELNLAWYNLSCGCGARVHDCDLWAPLLEHAAGGEPRQSPENLLSLQRNYLGASPRALWGIRQARSRPASPQRLYASVLMSLYDALGAETGARVIVDSSKVATDAYLLATLTDAELYVVHLVRDPRATAYSWGRTKQKDPALGLDLGQLRPTKSSAYWLRRNLTIEALLRPRLGDRYLRLRYEDFVADPSTAAHAVCDLLGEEGHRLPFLGARRIRLGPNHMVAGNPRRFVEGETEIRLDDEWRGAMPARSRFLASIPAAPLSRRYGYPAFAA